MHLVYIETINIMKEELNEKQKMFCLEYLKDFNATRAYKKVYWWTDNSAWVCWFKLLKNAKIQEYLWSKTEKKMDKLDVWVDFVLSWLKEIALIWMWKQKVMKNWKEQYILDLSNANSAYEKLWKYNKLFTDKVEQSGDLSINIVSYKKWQN
jgi:phage terminase small subunit